MNDQKKLAPEGNQAALGPSPESSNKLYFSPGTDSQGQGKAQACPDNLDKLQENEKQKIGWSTRAGQVKAGEGGRSRGRPACFSAALQPSSSLPHYRPFLRWVFSPSTLPPGHPE